MASHARLLLSLPIPSAVLLNYPHSAAPTLDATRKIKSALRPP